MKLFLFLLLVGLASVCYGQNATNRDSTDQPSSKQNSPKSDSPRPKTSAQSFEFLTAPVEHGAADRLILNLSSDSVLPDSSGTSCAYMRTYRVKRQERGSDVVVPAGYTTCVPTRHFEMKSAVQTQTEAGDDSRDQR
ncbi:MAG: hypothetical protein WBV46_05570 [Terriglobales bacterium]|jgi:hypothetical protein